MLGDSHDHTPSFIFRKAGAGTLHLEFLTNCLGFQAVSPLFSGVTGLPKSPVNVALRSFYYLISSNLKSVSADEFSWLPPSFTNSMSVRERKKGWERVG